MKSSKILAILMMAIMAGCGGAAVDTGATFDPSKASDEELLVFITRDGDTGKLSGYLSSNPELATMADSTGNTLLHHAAMAGSIRSAKLLLAEGADVNALNWDNLTPLAAANDRNAGPDIAEFLEDNGGQE